MSDITWLSHVVEMCPKTSFVFSDWASKLMMVGKLWHLYQEVCGALVIQLYREGHDDLTYEMWQSNSRKSAIAEELLLVAMCRLSKYLHESDDYKKKAVRVKEHIMDRLYSLQTEAATMPKVNKILCMLIRQIELISCIAFTRCPCLKLRPFCCLSAMLEYLRERPGWPKIAWLWQDVSKDAEGSFTLARTLSTCDKAIDFLYN